MYNGKLEKFQTNNYFSKNIRPYINYRTPNKTNFTFKS